MPNLIVAGASRGLGMALYQGLRNEFDKSFLLSRSKPSLEDDRSAKWVEMDLSKPDKLLGCIKPFVHNAPVDTLIYNAGIWENDTFRNTSQQELIDIINVNLTSLITLVHALHDNLVAGKGNIILIGSTCGLENEGANCVGYVAGKFGVRGAAHSLREYFRELGVRVTVINPGSMATDLPLSEPELALNKYETRRMPVSDILEVVKCVRNVSAATTLKEITIPATLDTDV